MQFAEQIVASVRGGQWQLTRSLEHVEEKCDIILADCPSAHNTVTDIALLACPRMLIPARIHPDTQRSIGMFIDQTDSLAALYDVKVNILGIVPVALSANTDHEDFFRMLPGQEPALMAPALRPHRALIDSARAVGRSIYSYESKTNDQKKAQRECQADYLALANFVLQKTNDISRNLDNSAAQNEDAEAHVKRLAAGALLEEHDDTGALDCVNSDPRPRKSNSFRLQQHIIQAVKEKYLDLRSAGVSVRNADVWEGLFNLGLKYSDELYTGYLSQGPYPRKSISIRLHKDVVRALERIFLDFSRAGAPATQADVREGLLMIGLKHSDELDEKYLGSL